MYSRSLLVQLPVPYRRVSQVPRRIFPCALSPTTPKGPVDAYSRFLSTSGRLHHLRQAGRPSTHVTRPNQVHFRYGSQVRLTRLRQTGLLRPTLARLHAERVIHMVDSFHSTRLASFTGTPKPATTPRNRPNEPPTSTPGTKLRHRHRIEDCVTVRAGLSWRSLRLRERIRLA